MKVALLPAAEVDAAFRAEWRALDAEPEEPANPYFSQWFLEPALARLAPPSVRLLTIRDDGGRLVGLAPVERGATYARLPAPYFAVWRHRHAYNGAPLFARGAAGAGYAAILDWIDGRPEGARFMRFTEHPVAPGHPLLATAPTRTIAMQADFERACLTGGRDFEAAFADGFAGKKRKELRRQWRRLGEQGSLETRRVVDPDGLAAAARAFLDLERAGWKSRDAEGYPLAADPAEAAFFKEAIAAGGRAGAVVCDLAAFDGRPIALLFSLRAGATLSAYKITYDEDYAAYSPGVHVLIEAMRLMTADPTIALFDSCARPGHPVVDHLWRERRRIVQVNLSASHRMDRALVRAADALDRLNRRLTARAKDRAGEPQNAVRRPG